ncbi:MAG: hypothetical protein RLY71_3481 [Pseudomonadota bacterium]|jgi:predicted ABC-type ATPase
MTEPRRILIIAGPNGAGKTALRASFRRMRRIDMAVARVAARVAQGGHNIPEDVIRRRFAAGLHNFQQHYQPVVDAWAHYDNSGEVPVLIDSQDQP